MIGNNINDTREVLSADRSELNITDVSEKDQCGDYYCLDAVLKTLSCPATVSLAGECVCACVFIDCSPHACTNSLGPYTGNDHRELVSVHTTIQILLKRCYGGLDSQSSLDQ